MYLTKSPLKTKKLRAVFSDGTHTDFGAAGMLDYTISKDKDQRDRYLKRHKKHESWNDAKSAGALSRWILWGDHTSIDANLRDYKVRFAGRV
jgi:hypothetical protein